MTPNHWHPMILHTASMPLMQTPRPEPVESHSEAHSAPTVPALHDLQPTDSSYESIGPSELSERVDDPGGVPTLDVPDEEGISLPFRSAIPSASRDCHAGVSGYKFA